MTGLIRDRRYLIGALLAVAVAAVVVLLELDTLSANVVDSSGYSWPLSTLFGRSPGDAFTGWQSIIGGGLLDPVPDQTLPGDYPGIYRTLLSGYLWVDPVYVATYAILLGVVILKSFATVCGRWIPFLMLALTVVADLAEDFNAGLVLHDVRSAGWDTEAAVKAATGLATAKWIAVLILGVLILGRWLVPSKTQAGGHRFSAAGRVGRALLHHRFSLALAVPLLVLTVASGYPVLEQLPDVQRAWVSSGGVGACQAIAALGALGLMAAVAEMLGRARTGYARRLLADPPTPPPSPLRLWLIGPALTALAALAVASGASEAPLIGQRMAIFIGVPVAVAFISWGLRKRTDTPYLPPFPALTDHDVAAIAFAGHAAALAILSIGGAGLLRSYVSVAVLEPSVGSAIALVVGTLMTVLPWVLAFLRGSQIDQVTVRPDRTFDSPLPVRPLWAILIALITVLVVFASLPFLMAQLGVAAVTMLALLGLMSLPAVCGLLIQDHRPPEIFQRLGLRRTPLITVVVVDLVLVGLFQGQGSISELERGTTRVSPESGQLDVHDSRPPFDEVVATWAHHTPTRSCVVRVAGQQIRPMLLVAAQGGGIRATYWTVAALDRIGTDRHLNQNPRPTTAGCGSYATAFSTGASGGSVGLTVARFSGNDTRPDAESSLDAVRRIAQPTTLAAAINGTFLRDPLYGASGVPLLADGPVPGRSWADRGRLVELGWTGQGATATWGDERFLTADELSPRTGPLILNSSKADTKCRVWVSQVQFDIGPPVGRGQDQLNCDDYAGPAPRAVDLFTAYGPFATDPAETDLPIVNRTHCLNDISAATAALLTARFPYVTPSGVVGSCPDPAPGTLYWPRTQLVDGGYLENTGLATITDLATNWSAQVRRYNTAALANNEPIIVPIVVFLSNDTEPAFGPTRPPRPHSELTVPPDTIRGGAASTTTTTALLQRAVAAVSADSFCPQSADKLAPPCDSVAKALPRRVVVVTRAAQPAVSAPLGWVLSQAAQDSLDRAMTHSADTACMRVDSGASGSRSFTELNASAVDRTCSQGYANLADLLDYLYP